MDAHPIPAEPNAVLGDDALAGLEPRSGCQGGSEGFRRVDAGQQRAALAGDERGQRRQIAGRARRRCFRVEQRHGAVGDGVDLRGVAVEVLNDDGLHVGAERRFHGAFPAGFHLQAFAEARRIEQTALAQPSFGIVAAILAAPQRGALHCGDGSQFAALPLRFRARRIHRLLRLRRFLAGVGQCPGVGGKRFVERVELPFGLAKLFGDPLDAVVGRRRRLLFQLVQPRPQAVAGLFGVIDAVFAETAFVVVGAGLPREVVPLGLPGTHPRFNGFETLRRALVVGLGLRQLRLRFLQLRADGGDAGDVRFQLVAGFLLPGGEGLRLRLQFADALAVELDGLFELAGDAVHLVLGRLRVVRRPLLLGVVGAALFDGGVQRLANAQGFFQANFELLRHGVALAQTFHDGLDAQRQQLGGAAAFLGLQLAEAFGGIGLALQVRQLAVEFFADVGEAREVLHGVANAVVRLAPTLLVLGDAGGFLQVAAQGVRLRLDQFGDHALFDDRIAARPEAGAEKDVGDVAAAAAGAVQAVDGLRIAPDFAADGDLRIGAELAADPRIAVVEQQFDGGQRGGLARRGAVEDDVGEGFAAQLAGGALAHHPAHRIDDVRLATAVRADDRAAVARQQHRRGVDEGLEPDELDFLESHLGRLPVRCRIDERLIAAQAEQPSETEEEGVALREGTRTRPAAGACHASSYAVLVAVHLRQFHCRVRRV